MESQYPEDVVTDVQPEPTQYAGFMARFIAHFIDWLILGIPLALISSRLPYFAIFVALLYYPVFEASRIQATIGKRAMDIIVTDEHGQRITVKASLVRFAMSLISGMFLLVGYLLFFFTKRKQTLHDLVAATVVIPGRRSGALGESWVDQLRSWAR